MLEPQLNGSYDQAIGNCFPVVSPIYPGITDLTPPHKHTHISRSQRHPHGNRGHHEDNIVGKHRTELCPTWTDHCLFATVGAYSSQLHPYNTALESRRLNERRLQLARKCSATLPIELVEKHCGQMRNKLILCKWSMKTTRIRFWYMVGKITHSFSKNLMFMKFRGHWQGVKDTMKQRGNVNYFKALKINNRKLLFEQILGHDLKN